jgi:hypothetical protein
MHTDMSESNILLTCCNILEVANRTNSALLKILLGVGSMTRLSKWKSKLSIVLVLSMIFSSGGTVTFAKST